MFLTSEKVNALLARRVSWTSASGSHFIQAGHKLRISVSYKLYYNPFWTCRINIMRVLHVRFATNSFVMSDGPSSLLPAHPVRDNATKAAAMPGLLGRSSKRITGLGSEDAKHRSEA